MSDVTKCQIVDCRGDATETELWRIGTARAFVSVCDDHGLHAKRGTRTAIVREDGQAERSAA